MKTLRHIGGPRLRFGPADVVAIIGKRGTGKSTAAKRVLGQALDDGHRVVCLDPHDEYSRHGRASDVVRLGPLDDRCTIEELCLDLARADERPRLLDDPRLSLAVVPRAEPEECAEDFETLLRAVEATGDVLLCVEELGYFEEHTRSKVNMLCTQSRHWRVPVLLVAQRAVQIPKTARTQLTQLVSFRQDNPDDLKALADLAGEQFAADVARLARGESKHWRDHIPAARVAARKEQSA